MLVIQSEKEYEEESENLLSFVEHPLYGELPEHEQEYEDTVAALDKWRKANPL